MTNCRYANVSDVRIHTEIHLCVYIVYLRHMHIRERCSPPCRFSSSCTPSFFCLALAPSRYSRRITELRTKIEGNGSHCSSRISTLFLRSIALFPRSTVLLDLSRKISAPSPPPQTCNRMDYFDLIHIYITSS